MDRVLLVRAGGQTCALELERVVEVLRPLPVRPLAGAPEMVEGLAVIRGEALAVVALERILLPAAAAPEKPAAPRYVVLRTGERRVALAVDAVLGIANLAGWQELPPLLRHAAGEAVAAIAAADAELLMALEAARLALPEMARAAAGGEA